MSALASDAVTETKPFTDAEQCVGDCYVRRFGEEPPPGCVVASLDLPLTDEERAQIIFDIVTLVRIVLDADKARNVIHSSARD